MGAGYHGGFGSTAGKVMNRENGHVATKQSDYTREQLIQSIHGVTPQATSVAEGISERRIHMSVLGDELFEKYLGVGHEVLGIASGDKIYVRRSSASLVSEIIHEGTHALEFKAGVSQDIIRTREGELRAYKAEHQFQKAAGMPLDFANEDEILIHVFRTYDNLDKKRRRKK